MEFSDPADVCSQPAGFTEEKDLRRLLFRVRIAPNAQVNGTQNRGEDTLMCRRWASSFVERFTLWARAS
jgi:hypothetical protein